MQYSAQNIFFRMSNPTRFTTYRKHVSSCRRQTRPVTRLSWFGRGNRLVVSKSFIIFEMRLTDMNLYIYTDVRMLFIRHVCYWQKHITWQKQPPIKPNVFLVTRFLVE